MNVKPLFLFPDELKQKEIENVLDLKDNTTQTITDSSKKIRTTNLKKAVLSVCEHYKRKPTFDELWQYFQNDKDTTGYISDYKDECVIWVTTKGDVRQTTKKGLKNMLSSIKSPL